MYNLEQIHKIIDATPAEMKGKNINDYRPHAISRGYKVDPDTHKRLVVYLTWQGDIDTYVVAQDGIIQ